jgi:protein XagA
MRSACLRLLTFGALLLASAGARAGAWLEPAGQGQVILGGTFADSLRAYDGNGRLAPLASYKKFELTAYLEYGALEQVTLIAAPSALDFRARPPGQSYAGFGVLEAGARVKIYDYEEWIFSGQATLREATNTRSRLFLDMGHGMQADIRLLVGRTFDFFGMPAFSSLEIGYRSPGGYGHEVRADATIGVRPLDHLLLLAQSFNISAVHNDPLYPTRSNKVALSAVYEVTPAIAVQFGGILGVPGINVTTERGIIAALWYRF